MAKLNFLRLGSSGCGKKFGKQRLSVQQRWIVWRHEFRMPLHANDVT